ncbi:hypothetical protein [Idiomarina sp.]|uniref:hypothetical protein n=1 Tax=Idiomarina sp. TaxID=1874361 RepID=UPI0025849618|nr:hypothetical protein [Idiomarina sp.]
MADREELVADCIELQQAVFQKLSEKLEALDEFADKIIRVAYCCELVNKDLDELYYKRHFNFCPTQVGIPPNPENTIPLKVCLYVDKLPVAYALGDINDARKAFEIHFMETSNFFGNTGLKGFIKYVFMILLSLRDVLKETFQIDMDSIVQVSPAQNSVSAFTEMGFDYIHDYGGTNNSAVVFKLNG